MLLGSGSRLRGTFVLSRGLGGGLGEVLLAPTREGSRRRVWDGRGGGALHVGDTGRGHAWRHLLLQGREAEGLFASARSATEHFCVLFLPWLAPCGSLVAQPCAAWGVLWEILTQGLGARRGVGALGRARVQKQAVGTALLRKGAPPWRTTAGLRSHRQPLGRTAASKPSAVVAPPPSRRAARPAAGCRAAQWEPYFQRRGVPCIPALKGSGHRSPFDCRSDVRVSQT